MRHWLSASLLLRISASQSSLPITTIAFLKLMTMFEIPGSSSFTGLRMVNRIFSHGSPIAPLLASSTCNFGSVDFDSSTSVCAFGSNSNTSISPIWSATEVEKNFAVPSGHSSRNSGVDVGQTLRPAGTQYGTLPGMTQPAPFPRYYLTNNPDRGWLPWPAFCMGAILP